MSRVDSYDRDDGRPRVGSVWVWELYEPAVRELIQVVDVKWNGEEWWVETKTLLRNPTYPPTGSETELNELGRFWEAATYVAGTNIVPPELG